MRLSGYTLETTKGSRWTAPQRYVVWGVVIGMQKPCWGLRSHSIKQQILRLEKDIAPLSKCHFVCSSQYFPAHISSKYSPALEKYHFSKALPFKRRQVQTIFYDSCHHSSHSQNQPFQVTSTCLLISVFISNDGKITYSFFIITGKFIFKLWKYCQVYYW